MKYREESRFSKFPSSRNPGNTHKQHYDIPFKRNFALGHAAKCGFQSICLLDDDISLTDEQFKKARHALAKDIDIASFHILDYPDVSTIDHIERIVRQRPSQVSIGGNCLFINTNKVLSFFPEAYNDDWYFIFSHFKDRHIVSLGDACQRTYTPWVDLDRIGFEQFGDIIIEGVKENVAAGRSAFSGGINYWKSVKEKYLKRLDSLLREPQASYFVKELKHARKVAAGIHEKKFINFLDNYQKEQTSIFVPKIKSLRDEYNAEASLLAIAKQEGKAAAFFGSRARGDAMQYSDYDVIVISEEENSGTFYFVPENDLRKAQNRVCVFYRTIEQALKSISIIDEDWPVRNAPFVHNSVIFDEFGIFDSFKDKIAEIDHAEFERGFCEALYHAFEHLGKVKNNPNEIKTREGARRFGEMLCRATAIKNKYVYKDYCNYPNEVKELEWVPEFFSENIQGILGFEGWNTNKITKISLQIWQDYIDDPEIQGILDLYSGPSIKDFDMDFISKPDGFNI